MISQQQQEALALLAEILELSPDIRLGQLFAHVGLLGEVHLSHGLGYIDDDELLSVLYRHRTELLARREEASGGALPAGTSAPMFPTPQPIDAGTAANR